MGSSYLPPPEQNVVNVGDELSQAAIDAINAAVSPSGTNPFVTASEAAGAGFSDYDNFKVYAAGDVVLASNDFYRFNTFIGAAGYGPITHPAAWTKLSTSDLTGYAQLAGGTFTGKVNFTPASGVAGLNVGIGGTSAASTTNGDLWITTGGANLNFRDGTGAWKVLASLQNGNVFNAPQVIDTTNNTSAALRVTQKGTGNAIEVEDSTTPDATRFVVDASGKVGIGGVVPANLDDKVAVHGGNIIFGWPYGVRFGDGTSIYSVNALTTQIQSSVQQGTINYIFSGSSVYSGSASSYAQYTYYDNTLYQDIYVDYLSYTYTYSVAWHPASMAFLQSNSSPDYPIYGTIVATFSANGGYNYGLRADGSGGVADVIQL